MNHGQALLFRQFVGRFKQIVLNGFKGFMRQIIGAAVGITLTVFRQPVGEVNHANAQRTTAHCAAFGSRNRVILIIEQSIQSAYCQNSQFFQLVQSFNLRPG